MLQNRVLQDVPPAPGPPAGLATDAFAAESGLLVAADRPRVVRVHVELDPVQAERGEPGIQEQAHGFRAVALALEFAIADQDPEFSGAVRILAHVDRAEPDRPLALAERDLELVLALPLVALLEPLLLLEAVQGTEARQELVVLRIVDPGLVNRAALDFRGPETDP